MVWSNLSLCAMLTHTHNWNQKPFARLSIFNWTSCASMNSKTSSFVSINGVIIWFQRLPPQKDHRNRGIEGQSLLQIFVNQLCSTIPTRAGGRLCPRDRPKLNIIGQSRSFLVTGLWLCVSRSFWWNICPGQIILKNL